MSYEDLMQWKGYLFLDNLVEPGDKLFENIY